VREYQLAAIPDPRGLNVLFTPLRRDRQRARERARCGSAPAALEEADRIKTAFVSNISYELRTPLTSIAGFAEMMEAGYAGELPGSARDYVGRS
jgi:signal transduction histidine kinase